MKNYTEVVAKIVDDYLERVRLQLRLVSHPEQEEFLREIQSHIFEAYQQQTETDDVARILAVLRNLGEPTEVVADRLPESMVRSGARRNLPLYVLGGILMALFGIPLGFGGVAVVLGVLAALTGVVLAYFATAAGFLLVGVIGIGLGLLRIFQAELWDRMVLLGYIHLDGSFAQLFEALSPSAQGAVIIVFFSVFAASGLGLIWLGKYLLRGLRFLFNLVLDWMRRLAQRVRASFSREPGKPVYSRSRSAIEVER
ncbi:MAG: hypothetical protein HY646_14575 [Acidobacteria bacterium]|nr:hypothetical protein [Acidobacteriota bacterium]